MDNINKYNTLINRICQLETQLENCMLPIEFKNYYNNYDTIDRLIFSESKIMVDKNTELGNNIINKIIDGMDNNQLYFITRQQYMRLFKDMEFFDDKLYNHVMNNNIIIVPKNKVIKVWYDIKKPGQSNNSIASIYYDGVYDSNILIYAIVIWMGSIEYVDELPDKL
jgi:hypothetical protein